MVFVQQHVTEFAASCRDGDTGDESHEPEPREAGWAWRDMAIYVAFRLVERCSQLVATTEYTAKGAYLPT